MLHKTQPSARALIKSIDIAAQKKAEADWLKEHTCEHCHGPLTSYRYDKGGCDVRTYWECRNENCTPPEDEW